MCFNSLHLLSYCSSNPPHPFYHGAYSGNVTPILRHLYWLLCWCDRLSACIFKHCPPETHNWPLPTGILVLFQWEIVIRNYNLSTEYSLLLLVFLGASHRTKCYIWTETFKDICPALSWIQIQNYRDFNLVYIIIFSSINCVFRKSCIF